MNVEFVEIYFSIQKQNGLWFIYALISKFYNKCLKYSTFNKNYNELWWSDSTKFSQTQANNAFRYIVHSSSMACLSGEYSQTTRFLRTISVILFLLSDCPASSTSRPSYGINLFSIFSPHATCQIGCLPRFTRDMGQKLRLLVLRLRTVSEIIPWRGYGQQTSFRMIFVS